MKKKLIWLAMVVMAVSGNAHGQKMVERADILLASGWQQIYDAYVPDAEAIQKLKPALPGLKAAVYFGSWCDDSKNNVPLFLKIIDTLNEPEFRVDFFSVEKKAADGQKYYQESLLIEKVPTFVFFIGDIEIGRIIENPKVGLLEDVMDIVFR